MSAVLTPRWCSSCTRPAYWPGGWCSRCLGRQRDGLTFEAWVRGILSMQEHRTGPRTARIEVWQVSGRVEVLLRVGTRGRFRSENAADVLVLVDKLQTEGHSGEACERCHGSGWALAYHMRRGSEVARERQCECQQRLSVYRLHAVAAKALEWPRA